MYIQIILYVVVAIAAWYVFFKREPRKGKPLPGPTGLPVIGYAHKLNGAPIHELFIELANKYGYIFNFKSLGENVIVLNEEDIVRSFFCDEQYKRFTNDRASIFWFEMVTYRSKGIIAARGDSPHSELRKNFVRGMHVYGEGIPAFEDIVQSELGKLNGQLESFHGKEFDLQTLIKNFLYSFISILLSGQPIHDDATRQMFWDFDNCSDYFIRPDVNLILSTIPALRFVPGPYKRHFDALIRARDVLLQKYLYDATKAYKPGQIRGLVDFYLNEQRLTNAESCSDERICAAVLETLFAGVITTLSHLSSFFLCMIDHPEYQTKIQEEVDRVIGTERHPSLSDKKDCEMTEAVTLEVHRYLTPAPFPGPRMCTKNLEFRGYNIPAQSTILINLWLIHHDEKVWGDPFTFRPERWIGDNGTLLPNDHVLRKKFLAFGMGRRQCVGESLARSRAFLFVTTVLQRWNFEMSPGQTKSSDPRDGDFSFNSTCIPTPYLCRAVPRKK